MVRRTTCNRMDIFSVENSSIVIVDFSFTTMLLCDLLSKSVGIPIMDVHTSHNLLQRRCLFSNVRTTSANSDGCNANLVGIRDICGVGKEIGHNSSSSRCLEKRSPRNGVKLHDETLLRDDFEAVRWADAMVGGRGRGLLDSSPCTLTLCGKQARLKD